MLLRAVLSLWGSARGYRAYIVALGTSLPELVTAVALWLFVMRGRKLGRVAGIVMLVMYAVYFVMII
jgi:Ca2+/Na+ antiporter